MKSYRLIRRITLLILMRTVLVYSGSPEFTQHLQGLHGRAVYARESFSVMLLAFLWLWLWELPSPQALTMCLGIKQHSYKNYLLGHREGLIYFERTSNFLCSQDELQLLIHHQSSGITAVLTVSVLCTARNWTQALWPLQKPSSSWGTPLSPVSDFSTVFPWVLFKCLTVPLHCLKK